MPSSRSGSHSLTLMTVGGKSVTSSSVANDGHASGLPASSSLDAVGDGAAVVVQVDEQDAVVLDRGREAVLRPATGDVRAQRVEAADEPDVAVAEQLHARSPASGSRRRSRRRRRRGRRRCRSSAALADDQLHAGHAVVEAGRERRDLGRRRRRQAVAEVDHRHGHALVGDDPAPRSGTCRRSTTGLHAAAVDVVHARQRRRRPVGRMNCTLTVLPSGLDVSSMVLTSRPFDGATSSLSSISSMAVICSRWATASGRLSLGEQHLSAGDVRLRGRRHHRHHGLDPRIDAGVVGKSAHWCPLFLTVRRTVGPRRSLGPCSDRPSSLGSAVGRPCPGGHGHVRPGQ